MAPPFIGFGFDPDMKYYKNDFSSTVAREKLLGGGQPLFENDRKTKDHAVNNLMLAIIGGIPSAPPQLPTGLLYAEKNAMNQSMAPDHVNSSG